MITIYYATWLCQLTQIFVSSFTDKFVFIGILWEDTDVWLCHADVMDPNLSLQWHFRKSNQCYICRWFIGILWEDADVWLYHADVMDPNLSLQWHFRKSNQCYACRWNVYQQFWDIIWTRIGYFGSISTKLRRNWSYVSARQGLPISDNYRENKGAAKVFSNTVSFLWCPC